MNAQIYQRAMKEAKSHVAEIRKYQQKISIHQAKIAEIALEVCDIRHGGRCPDDRYTLTRFSSDIGLPLKTVQNWVQTYRLVAVDAEIKMETRADWVAASRTSNLLKKERSSINKMNDTPRSLGPYKKKVPKQRIIDIYTQVKEDKPFINEFAVATESAKRVKFLMDKRDLNIIEDFKLVELMEILDYASEKINEHLTSKAKLTRDQGIRSA